MQIRLPIDTKSLFFNIKNDNEAGHTATVSTPIRQYGGVDEDLVKVFKIDENVNVVSKEAIADKLVAKSRAEAKIVKVLVFDRISVNGEAIDAPASFCMYVREETAASNVHCGRQKLHYPMSLKYSDSEVEVNNKEVLKAVAEKLKNYAFVVEAFEYNTDTGILNFDVTIVGCNGIPYSKVFINRRGVGGKFSSVFSDEAVSYDAEIIAMRQKLGYRNVGPDNFGVVLSRNRSIAGEVTERYLLKSGCVAIKETTVEYPYSLYDLEYFREGIKHYTIIRFTSTKNLYFNLPCEKIRFCADFPDRVTVVLVSDVNGKPRINEYSVSEMNHMSKSINSVCYELTGGNYE